MNILHLFLFLCVKEIFTQQRVFCFNGFSAKRANSCVLGCFAGSFLAFTSLNATSLPIFCSILVVDVMIGFLILRSLNKIEIGTLHGFLSIGTGSRPSPSMKSLPLFNWRRVSYKWWRGLFEKVCGRKGVAK